MSFICSRCDRWYNSSEALAQHKRDSKVHQLCSLCDDEFSDSDDLQEHHVYEHWSCEGCDAVYWEEEDLDEHIEERHRFECKFCIRTFVTPARRDAHSSTSHRPCRTCGKRFRDENQVVNHEITHKPRRVRCWGCYETFKELSHVFLHLESGACDCGIDADDVFNNAAKLGGPWRNYGNDINIIQCPGCDRSFGKVSGFLQHIESKCCDENYFSGQKCVWGLLRQLRRNLKFEPQTVYGIAV